MSDAPNTHLYVLTDEQRRIVARALELSTIANGVTDNPASPIVSLLHDSAPDGVEALG